MCVCVEGGLDGWNSERRRARENLQVQKLEVPKKNSNNQNSKRPVLKGREMKPLFGALPLKMNSQKEVQEEKQPIEGQDQYLPLHTLTAF